MYFFLDVSTSCSKLFNATCIEMYCPLSQDMAFLMHKTTTRKPTV